MSELATIDRAALSQGTAEIVRRWSSGQDLGPKPTVPASVRDEARRKLPGIDAQLKAADARAWHAFLRPLVNAVRNPPTADAVSVFAATCAATLQDIPAAVLTANAQREACRKFAFWPAIADLNEWLSPEAVPMRRDARALARIAKADIETLQAPVADPVAPDALAALAAELGAKAPHTQERSQAAGLKPQVLAAHYDATAERLASDGHIDRAQAMFDRAARLRDSVAA
jgi:hypothetical protein